MTEIEIRAVRYDEPAVQQLVGELLEDLARRYGGTGDDTPVSPADFAPPRGRFFVACRGDELIGCVGWRVRGEDAELKRMFTATTARGQGVARRLLAAVEESARADGRKRVILETGDKQPEAVALYQASGYKRIPDFGYYKDEEGVLSFGRAL